MWAWRYVFLLAALIFSSATTIYLWKIDVKRQEWDSYEKSAKPTPKQYVNGKHLI